MAATDAYTDAEVLCEGCKRPLHEPASRALGRGPVCRRGLRALTPASPGQLALDIPIPDQPED